MYKTYKVLLVEDDLTHAMIVKQLLHQSKEFSFQVQHATYLSGAVSLLTKENFDVVLLDLNLPDSQGTDTIEKILHTNSTVPIMSITGYEATGSLSKYLNNGIQDYLDSVVTSY
jgi:DNA-binding response OmpR family regulator